jgi:hypothetical protein
MHLPNQLRSKYPRATIIFYIFQLLDSILVQVYQESPMLQTVDLAALTTVSIQASSSSSSRPSFCQQRLELPFLVEHL